MNQKQYNLSIIIACYNEGSHLLDNINKIEQVMDQTKYSYEFIFIDDCSCDNTKEVIKEICSSRNNTRYIFHQKNVGRGGTVKEGLLLSDSKYAGFLDVDLEISARYIPAMLLLLDNGYNLTSIDRLYHIQFTSSSLIRTLFSKINKKIIHSFLKIKSPDPEAGYRFFNMENMKKIIEQTTEKKWLWDTEIIYRAEKAKEKIKFIPGVFIKNKDKKSTVNLAKDTILHIKGLFRIKKNI